MKIENRLLLLQSLQSNGKRISILKIIRTFFHVKTGYGVIYEFERLGLITINKLNNKYDVVITQKGNDLLSSSTKEEDYIKLKQLNTDKGRKAK